MPSLHSVPIVTAHGVIYGDLRLPIYHGMLAGSRTVDDGENLVMSTFIDPGNIAYDIGALAGVYTLVLAEYVGPSGKVLVFEPNTRLLPTLERTCSQLANVSLHPVALSDSEGTVALFIPVDDASMTSLSDWTDGAGGDVIEISCESRRLDDMVENFRIPLPDFIKCDVEGAEIAVFRGAEKTLNRTDGPCILFEVNPRATAAFGVEINEPLRFLRGLERADYKFYDIRGDRLIGFDDANSLIMENGFFRNIVAVPAARRNLLSRLASE